MSISRKIVIAIIVAVAVSGCLLAWKVMSRMPRHYPLATFKPETWKGSNVRGREIVDEDLISSRISVEDDLLKNHRPKDLPECFDSLGVPDMVFTKGDAAHKNAGIEFSGDEVIVLEYNTGADWTGMPLMSALYPVVFLRVGIDSRMVVTRMERFDVVQDPD